MMQVKIFQGWGHSGVLRMEAEINKWIKDERPKVARTETTSCAAGDPGDEMGQAVTVSVWHETD